MLQKINFRIIPLQVFFFTFWFKNGFIDKVMGVILGVVSPETAYKGDTWGGWAGYIVGTWDKSAVTQIILSPTFSFMFPILILLQCLPFIFALISIFKGETLNGSNLIWINRAAVSSLFVTSGMLFTQTLSGASDGQYLWQLLGFGMIALMYLKSEEPKA